MNTIVVINPASTGISYLQDIRMRGYEPVVLNSFLNGASNRTDHLLAARAQAAELCEKQKIRIYEAHESYEETLALVKSLDPVLVLAGSETAVELTARLLEDLGMPCNSYANIGKYTNKADMHEALRSYGIRSIRGRIVTSPEEADAFMAETGTEAMVVKPNRSAGSRGLKFCDNAAEVHEGIAVVLGGMTFLTDEKPEALLQERIFGTEYIVNTVSRSGNHKVISVWKYDKVQTRRGGYIYNYMESVNELETGHSELIDYAFSVLDALEVKNGPVHGEFMVDDRGPVLIEVNCRAMGGSVPPEWGDQIFGHHETDIILDCMLDEAYFNSILEQPLHAARKGFMKFLITPKQMDITASPIRVLLKHLQSVHSFQIHENTGPFHLNKTEDLETNSGCIYMVHSDERIVSREVELLHLSEMRYFNLFYHENRNSLPSSSAVFPPLETAAAAVPSAGSALAVSDRCTYLPNVKCIAPEDLANETEGFDTVFFDLSSYGEGHEVEHTIEVIFAAMDKVKFGGRFIVTENFYRRTPYGRAMIDALLMFGGLTIQAPTCRLRNLVIGIRR